MCIKYDDVLKKCLECADEYVLIDHTYTDAVTNNPETVPICVLANEHLNCESNLLKLNSNNLQVVYLTFSKF